MEKWCCVFPMAFSPPGVGMGGWGKAEFGVGGLRVW